MALDIIPPNGLQFARLSAGEKYQGLFVLQNDREAPPLHDGTKGKAKFVSYIIYQTVQAMMRSDVEEILVMAEVLDPPQISTHRCFFPFFKTFSQSLHRYSCLL